MIRVGGQEGIDYPGFCRVVWRAHVSEMSDLANSERQHLMALVFATESALRRLYAPKKINLASLGNLVPHLHWHVIPRYVDDPLFPAPIWAGTGSAGGSPAPRPVVRDLALHQAISQAFSEISGGAG